MDVARTTLTARLVAYDAEQRRLWIAGQRSHHGAWGALLAVSAVLGLLGLRMHPRRVVSFTTAGGLAAAGSLLMVHDWHDRAIWFERGAGSQPPRRLAP